MLPMKKIKRFFNVPLDILFPRKKEERKLDEITAEKLFNQALKNSHEDKNILTIFDYNDDLIRQAIWSLKFRKNTSIARIFAQILYDQLLEDLFDLRAFSNFKDPVLIPMPISRERRRERGFNQCELIANELADLSGGILNLEKNSLIKTKDTPPQSRTKNKKERLENLKNCFAIKNKEKIKNKNIILLDDVTTTGATLREAKKVLRRYGAKKIICITLAH